MQTATGLKEQTMNRKPGYHPALQIAARIISFIFHPLFIPVYIIFFYLHFNPAAPFFDPWDKTLIMIRAGVMYVMFPLVTVLLLKAVGFIQSIYLRTQKDRIVPYIACGLFYFWMWYVLRNQSMFTDELVLLSLAIFLASSGGLLANTYLKVSMHAISMGILITYIYQLAMRTDAHFGFWISVAFLIAGLVCTARMITSDHDAKEIYWGLAIGIMGQVLAYWVVF